MSIVDQVNQDIKSAMLAKEKEKLEALRAIKSAILLLNSSGNGEVAEDDVVKTMQKLVKQRKESAEIYIEQGRKEMADEEIFQADVIQGYLPEMLSEDDVRAAVKEVIQNVGASTAADMGKVMGPVMAKLQGRADGKLISQIVKSELS